MLGFSLNYGKIQVFISQSYGLEGVVKRFVAALILMGGLLMAGGANAGTATVTGTYTSGLSTLTASIPPANTQNNSFPNNSTSGPYKYNFETFTVTQSGLYSATMTVNNSIQTTWFMSGVFVPSSNPLNPLPTSSYISSYFVNSINNSASFTNLSLVAGQIYTALVAYGNGTNSTNYTLTINGPGCIEIGSNSCATPVAVPTLSEWSQMLLGLMVLAMIGWHFHKQRSY